MKFKLGKFKLSWVIVVHDFKNIMLPSNKSLYEIFIY